MKILEGGPNTVARGPAPPPAAPPVPPSPPAFDGGFGGSGNATIPGAPGFTPDYPGLIANDPGYLAAIGSVNAADTGSAAQRTALIRQALIKFGLIPDLGNFGFSGDILGAVDDQTRALAAQNTASGLSTQAQLGQGHETAIRNLRNQLAARGILSSGETNYQSNQEQGRYAQAQDSALGALLGGIGGYQSTYLQGHQAGLNTLAQAASDAATRQMNLPQNQPTAATPAQNFHYNPTSGNYEGGNGKSYTPWALNSSNPMLIDQDGVAWKFDPSSGAIGERIGPFQPAGPNGL